MSALGVTDHCVDRFIQYTGVKRQSPTQVRDKILEMVGKSKRVELKPGYRANNVIKNGMRNSVFKRFSDWIFVLDLDQTTVITCYPSSALRWVNSEPNN